MKANLSTSPGPQSRSTVDRRYFKPAASTAPIKSASIRQIEAEIYSHEMLFSFSITLLAIQLIGLSAGLAVPPRKIVGIGEELDDPYGLNRRETETLVANIQERKTPDINTEIIELAELA